MSELSSAKVLARMKSGRMYPMSELSHLVDQESALIRPVVEQMERDGLLGSRIRSDRHKCFFLAGTEHLLIKSAPKAVNVATPLIPHLMTGELAGYECQFTRYRDLCMSIRRAA